MEWYRELFKDYAGKYDQESYIRGTAGEVDFIEEEIGRGTRRRILDIGCGTGRHAIELARRGFAVTGLDLSESMLRAGRAKAEQAGVPVRFVCMDARTFRFARPFDAVIMICEGAFPLMDTDQENHRILQNAWTALGRNGKFIFTTLNGLYPLFNSVTELLDAESTQGRTSDAYFDLLTFRYHSVYETEDDAGNRKTLRCTERYYTPPELRWLLQTIGFVNIDILGCPIGEWSRRNPLTPNDLEMLVVAEKP